MPMEEVGIPASDHPGTKIAAMAPYEEDAQALRHVVVQLEELPGRIPGAEVVAPAAQHRVKTADQHPHVLHAVAMATGQFLHALAHPLHAAPRGPTLEVEAADAALQEPPRDALVHVTAEKVEALAALGEVHAPRLLRV